MNTYQAILNFYHMMLILTSQNQEYMPLKGDCRAVILSEEDEGYSDMIMILMNNGCRLAEDVELIYVTLAQSPIDLIFIQHGLGNETNEFFDYIEYADGYSDSKALVVFLDYFQKIRRDGDPMPEDAVQRSYVELYGNSEYYDAIKRISDIFISLVTLPAVHMNLMSATAASNMYRWNSSIIAASIIDKIKPLEDVDVTDMSLDVAHRLITNVETRLKGIRILPEEAKE